MSDIVREQYPETAPLPEELTEGTNALLPTRRTTDRLSHFPEETYNLSAESHLSRFLKVILGEAGIGQIRKRYLVARFQQALQGTNFLDLDRFYGSLFGMRRRSHEELSFDPHSEVATGDEWAEVHAKDGSYRTRIEQFGKAIGFGATPTGMELAAEALLSVDCDVYESFTEIDRTFLTYGQIAADVGTYGGASAFTYGELEGVEDIDAESQNRWRFTIRPKRPISLAERYDVMRTLRRLKPVNTIMEVSHHGSDLHEEHPLRRIVADSNFWEIRNSIIPASEVAEFYPRQSTDGSAIEQPRPPFSGYQGEAWSYNGDIIGVIGSVVTPDGTTKAITKTRVHYGTRGTLDYTPPMAVQSRFDIEAGRLASDGILVSHPYSRTRTALLTVGPGDQLTAQLRGVVPQVWMDYIGLDPRHLVWLREQHWSPLDHPQMWATPERLIGDRTQEVVEIRFADNKLVNHISFDIARYPHLAAVEIWDLASGSWRRIYNHTINESVPRVIGHIATLGPHHPQHHTPDHWTRQTASIIPTLTNKVRFVLMRQGTTGPVGPTGLPVAYSLALRSIDIGYRIRSLVDVPPSIDGEIARTRDVFGSVRIMSLHRETGQNLLIDGKQWRSEPQPSPRAVVNLYVDGRTQDGDAQLLERFYLDPIESGSRLNLYWSNDEPGAIFDSSEDALPLGIIDIEGTVTPRAAVLDLSGGGESRVDVPTRHIDFDPTKPWWIAMRFAPRWPSADAQEHELFSFGQHRIYVSGNSLSFTLDDGTPVSMVIPSAATWPGNTIISLFVEYEDGALTLRISHAAGSATEVLALPSGNEIQDQPEIFSVGGMEADYSLYSFSLGVGAIDDWEETFDYAIRPGNREEIVNGVLLRYHHTWATTDNPFGFVGGPGDYFAELTWKPVPRDYVVQKGYIKLPPIEAKYWKFEFTNLVAQPYESFLPINRKIKVFPPHTRDLMARPTRWESGVPGFSYHQELGSSGVYAYNDGVLAATPGFDIDVTDRLATTALYAENEQISQRLADTQSLYGFQYHHQGTLGPQFAEEGLHLYDESIVVHSTKVAYFIGLRELRAYRLDYQVDDDTLVYRDLLFDDQNIEDGYTWEFDPNRIYTDETGLPSVATSRTFESVRQIEAIQFATHQNEAIQIIPDDQFRDPGLIGYDWSDEALWHTVGDATAAYSSATTTVKVQRRIQEIALDSEDLISGIDQPLPTPTFSVRGDDATEVVAQSFGGVESPPLTISDEGRIHAAVRLTVDAPLTQPLTLQIVALDGTLLASRTFTPQSGQTSEETLTYIINSYVPRYASLESPFEPPRSIVDDPFQPLTDPELEDSADAPPDPETKDDQVRIRIVQHGDTADSWTLDALSLFDESIVWEFSNDGGDTWYTAYGVRNFINGILTFPDPGNQLRWRVTGYRSNLYVSSIQLRPWYRGLNHLRTATHFRGPNVSTYDHEPPIQDDPEFSMWHRGVPRHWFLAGRSYPKLPVDPNVPTNEFSLFYGRSGAEDISGTLSESVDREHIAFRDGVDDISDPVVEPVGLACPEILHQNNSMFDDFYWLGPSADGTLGYMVDDNGANLVVLDLATLAVEDTISLGLDPSEEFLGEGVGGPDSTVYFEVQVDVGGGDYDQEIRALDITTGTITTVATSGISGYFGYGILYCHLDDKIYVRWQSASDDELRRYDHDGTYTTVIDFDALGFIADLWAGGVFTNDGGLWISAAESNAWPTLPAWRGVARFDMTTWEPTIYTAPVDLPNYGTNYKVLGTLHSDGRNVRWWAYQQGVDPTGTDGYRNLYVNFAPDGTATVLNEHVAIRHQDAEGNWLPITPTGGACDVMSMGVITFTYEGQSGYGAGISTYYSIGQTAEGESIYIGGASGYDSTVGYGAWLLRLSPTMESGRSMVMARPESEALPVLEEGVVSYVTPWNEDPVNLTLPGYPTGHEEPVQPVLPVAPGTVVSSFYQYVNVGMAPVTNNATVIYQDLNVGVAIESSRSGHFYQDLNVI